MTDTTDRLSRARALGIAARGRLTERGRHAVRCRSGGAARRFAPAVVGGRSRGTILAVPGPTGDHFYPACQFTERGLVPGMRSFLRAFADAESWTCLVVLLLPSKLHAGRTALDLLEAGMTAQVVSIAATYGEQG